MVSLATLICVVIIFAAKEYVIAEASNDVETLRMVHVFFQQGDRAPGVLYPNDPLINRTSEIWPNGLGQLTKIGQAMNYDLGLWLRKKYDGFIKKDFDAEEFYIRSIEEERSLMAAQLVSAGFYRPDDDTKFKEDLPWLPTPVHTAPKKHDKLLDVDVTCPKITTELSKLQKSEEIQNFLRKKEELFNYVFERAGWKRTNDTLFDFLTIYTTLSIERFYNLTIPDWAMKRYDEIKDAASFYFQYFSYTNELKRLRVGPQIGLMTENMQNKSKGELSNQKMFIFSTNSFHISAILNSMGVFDGSIPPPSSALIVELHQIRKSYFVKALFQNDTSFVSPPHDLLLPGCSPECSLSKWTDLLGDVIPKEWEKECQIKAIAGERWAFKWQFFSEMIQKLIGN